MALGAKFQKLIGEGVYPQGVESKYISSHTRNCCCLIVAKFQVE